MADRPVSDLEMMAERIADVLNGHGLKMPVKAEDVGLRTIAEFCWALDVTPSIEFRLMDRASTSKPPNGGE